MSLHGRLSSQLAKKGVKDPKGIAYGVMRKRGDLDDKGLTKKGKKRQSMSASERAKDRQSKYSKGKHKKSDYKYDSKTNMARLK